MDLRTLGFGTIGVAATLTGIVLLVAPELVLGIGGAAWVVTTLSSLEATTLGLVAGCLAVLYLGLTARSRPAPETVASESRTETRFEMATTAPPEEETADQQTLTATTVDDDIAEAIDVGDDALTAVREQLRLTAISTYAVATDTPRDTAQAAIERGTWTEDPLAATFLGGPAGPEPSLWLRIRLWLVPARERRRRIERTLVAIEGMR